MSEDPIVEKAKILVFCDYVESAAAMKMSHKFAHELQDLIEQALRDQILECKDIISEAYPKFVQQGDIGINGFYSFVMDELYKMADRKEG